MEKNYTRIGLASIALAALMAAPAFAQSTSGTASTTATASVATKIACIGTAVNARETDDETCGKEGIRHPPVHEEKSGGEREYEYSVPRGE